MKQIFVAVPNNTTPEVIEKMRKEAHRIASDLEISDEIKLVFATDVVPKNLSGTPEEITRAKFKAICDAMTNSDLLIANHTPYLGVEPDPDVIVQLGFMAAQQKPVFSYSNVSKPFYQRVEEWNGKSFTKDGTLERDVDNMRIENMGIKKREVKLENPGPDNFNNLMLEGPSFMTGSDVLTPEIVGTNVTENEIYTDTSVFENAFTTAAMRVIKQNNIRVTPPPMVIPEPNSFYVAGPGVFLPDLFAYFDDTKRIGKENGINGVAPVDAQLDFGTMQSWATENGNNPRMRKAIYEGDTSVMQRVRGGVFNLTPHHGAAGDSGTIYELGYMLGKDYLLGRKPMLSVFSNEPEAMAVSADNWVKAPKGPVYGSNSHLTDHDQTLVYSLMIDGAVLLSGGSLNHRPIINIDGLTADKKYSYLEYYQSCVKDLSLRMTAERRATAEVSQSATASTVSTSGFAFRFASPTMPKRIPQFGDGAINVDSTDETQSYVPLKTKSR